MSARYERNKYDALMADWDWWEYYDIYPQADGSAYVVGSDCLMQHRFDTVGEARIWCNKYEAPCSVCVVMGG